MLRAFVLCIGAALLLGGIVLGLAVRPAWPGALELCIFGAIVLAGVLFERHYRGQAAGASAHLQSTGERFVDPVSGKLTEVLYDSRTGERVYRQM